MSDGGPGLHPGPGSGSTSLCGAGLSGLHTQGLGTSTPDPLTLFSLLTHRLIHGGVQGGAARRIREEEWRLEKAVACRPGPSLCPAWVKAHTPGAPGWGLELVFGFWSCPQVQHSRTAAQTHADAEGQDPRLPSVPWLLPKIRYLTPWEAEPGFPNTAASTARLARHLRMPGAVPSMWVICNRRNLEIAFVSVEDGLTTDPPQAVHGTIIQALTGDGGEVIGTAYK